jgi:invasion protein IalB
MKLRASRLVLASLFVAAPFPASAQQASPPSATKDANAQPLDLNQVVCERQEVLGSRLATKRVCMTRSQWADLRAQDRQEIERVQTQRSAPPGH